MGQFESSSPSQTRSAERQRVELGRFHPQISVTSTLLADLTFPKPGAVLQHLLLDEDEQFGGLILGLSLRGLNLAYEPPHRFSAAINNPERFSFAIGVTPTPAQFPINLFPDPPDLAEAPSAIHNRPDTPPSTPPITWSISLADGFDRLFRAWFENPALPCPHEDRPCAPTPAPRRATATHTLEPAPRGGLREARLRCVQVAPTACGRDLYGRPQGEVAVFEYTYESLVVDVARVLVRMEEGIEQGRGEEAVVVLQWLRL